MEAEDFQRSQQHAMDHRFLRYRQLQSAVIEHERLCMESLNIASQLELAFDTFPTSQNTAKTRFETSAKQRANTANLIISRQQVVRLVASVLNAGGSVVARAQSEEWHSNLAQDPMDDVSIEAMERAEEQTEIAQARSNVSQTECEFAEEFAKTVERFSNAERLRSREAAQGEEVKEMVELAVGLVATAREETELRARDLKFAREILVGLKKRHIGSGGGSSGDEGGR